MRSSRQRGPCTVFSTLPSNSSRSDHFPGSMRTLPVSMSRKRAASSWRSITVNKSFSLDSLPTGSSTICSVPPQGSPKRVACSWVTPYVVTSGFSAAIALPLTLSMRSSSTQPPETEPMTWPSSRIASMAPTGRGAEPQVLTMVPSATRRPALRQSSAVRRTSISTLSMGEFYLNPAARPARAFADLQRGAVRRRDFAHDGEPQAAAGARGAPHAVEPLHDALALTGRNAGAVIFDLDERQPFASAFATRARSRTHRDVAAARQILERVVHQVTERFAQQEHVAMHAGGL